MERACCESWLGRRVLTTLIVVMACIGPACADLPWFKDDIEAAFKEAKVRNRPLLVFFHTTWCSWCLEYEDKVFSDEDVVNEASAFVPLRLNCDRREGQKLMRRYNVASFPTILALSQSGEVLGRLGMYRPVPDFLRFLEAARTPGETLAALDARIAASGHGSPGAPDAPDATYPKLLLRSATGHFEAGDSDRAAEGYARAIDAASAASDAETIVDARIGLAALRAMRGEDAEALVQYKAVLSGFPDSKRLAEAFVGAIVILRDQDRNAEIDALFTEYAGRFPDDPAVLNDHARRILDAKGDTTAAVAKATKAVSLSPRSGEYRETLARALLAAGKRPEALEAVQDAIMLRPTDKELRLLRLDILEAIRLEAAREATPKTH